MSTTFGYMKAWAKGAIKTLLEEYVVDDGILLSGNMSLKADQASALVAYLNDPANMGQYGIPLDFVLFFKEDEKVQISGKFTTPYKKEGESNATTTTRAKRTM